MYLKFEDFFMKFQWKDDMDGLTLDLVRLLFTKICFINCNFCLHYIAKISLAIVGSQVVKLRSV